jgi:endogenous inhibitor of DNA gyrase (YacG/DUF329 family)
MLLFFRPRGTKYQSLSRICAGAIALSENDPVPRPEAELGRSRRCGLVELGRWKAIYERGEIPLEEAAETAPASV